MGDRVVATRVVVIGSGWGQLAVALRLSARGHAVTLLCPEPSPPALLSLPNRLLVPAGLRELVGRTGAELGELVTIAASEPALTAHFPSGAPISLPGAGVGPSISAVRAARGELSAQSWRELLAEGARTWSAMRDATNSPAGAGEESQVEESQEESLSGSTGLDSLLDRARRESDPQVGMLAMCPAILAGLDPATTPQAGITLAYLEATFGVWHVTGGLHKLVQALIDRLTYLKATVRYDQPDATIEAESGRMVTVRTAHERYPAELVVVGPNLPHDACLEFSLRPGPDTPAAGAHVWFPSGLQPQPADPLAIAGWIEPDDDRSVRATPARLIVRLPTGCQLTLEETLAHLAAAGTDLRQALISATDHPCQASWRPPQLPTGEPAGLVALVGVAESAPHRARHEVAGVHPNSDPHASERGKSRTSPIPWAAAGEASWTGMVGQLLRAEELARTVGSLG